MLLEKYTTYTKRSDFYQDSAQVKVIEQFQTLYDELAQIAQDKPSSATTTLLNALRLSQKKTAKGIYLWGGVGRGKTFLMDMFYELVPTKYKKRQHFHSFMRDIHNSLQDINDKTDPLTVIAEDYAKKFNVICLDELYVSDITDAMLLSGLLQALADNHVCLITTSNIHPDNLYKDGLQRERFLPAIETIKNNNIVLKLGGSRDYRLMSLEKLNLYHYPLSSETESIMLKNLNYVSPDWFNWFTRKPQASDDYTFVVINKRNIDVKKVTNNAMWCTFDSLCSDPRSQVDYIELAQIYETVLISDIPIMDETMDDYCRRFISLIDEFYDRKVKVIMSAEGPASNLYKGSRLSEEFRRTTSRIAEMQTQAYLATEHKS